MTSKHPDTTPEPSANEVDILIAEAGGKKGLMDNLRNNVPPRLISAHDNSAVRVVCPRCVYALSSAQTQEHVVYQTDEGKKQGPRDFELTGGPDDKDRRGASRAQGEPHVTENPRGNEAGNLQL